MELEERPLPRLKPGEVLLRIDRCGVCASDLLAIEGAVTDYSPPVVLGHEIAATVEESREPSVSVGQRLSVNPMITCGKCRSCRRGEHKYCPHLYGIGHDIDGGFAEYMVAPAPLVAGGGLLLVPEEVPPDRLLFLEPLGCVLSAWEETPFRESLAVLGAGPIGLLFVQLAREAGLQTVVLEPQPHRRELARQLGAEAALPPGEESEAQLREQLDGGADTVIVATDHPQAIEAAFRIARRGGAINFFGLAPKGRTLTLELEQLHFQGYRIQASWAFSRRSLEASRRRIVEGKIDLTPFVTRRFRLEEANAAIEYARSRAGVKAVFAPHELKAGWASDG
ncbi:MAG: alcohol dehydrogenase [Candidatus Poribacteria bacterium]|nr:MAG: alcohol dehydrogenase [Candidatus Poribacteria bacterium]